MGFEVSNALDALVNEVYGFFGADAINPCQNIEGVLTFALEDAQGASVNDFFEFALNGFANAF